MPFTNQKVIVTGANRSMGKKMALMFAENGADVVISYHSDPEGAQETLAAIQSTGRKAHAIQADFSNMNHVATFAEKAIAQLGHVDILINNAATNYRETLFECTPEDMQRVFQTNSVSPLYLLQLCAKNMVENNKKGCIINISSIAATTTMPHAIVYAASKAAMNKWTQNAALDTAKHGIRVNTIAPGVIASGMNQDTATNNPALWQKYTQSIPLKRTGTPDDIANMALFLASHKADWITGQVFEVDGGHAL